MIYQILRACLNLVESNVMTGVLVITYISTLAIGSVIIWNINRMQHILQNRKKRRQAFSLFSSIIQHIVWLNEQWCWSSTSMEWQFQLESCLLGVQNPIYCCLAKLSVHFALLIRKMFLNFALFVDDQVFWCMFL